MALLCIAAETGNWDLFWKFVERIEDKNPSDASGRTPLELKSFRL